MSVTVSIADDHQDQFPQIVDELRRAGLTVEKELGEIGVVTGSVAPKDIATIEQVEGVAFVEPEASFQIAPPESDLQ